MRHDRDVWLIVPAEGESILVPQIYLINALNKIGEAVTVLNVDAYKRSTDKAIEAFVQTDDYKRDVRRNRGRKIG